MATPITLNSRPHRRLPDDVRINEYPDRVTPEFRWLRADYTEMTMRWCVCQDENGPGMPLAKTGP